MWILIDLIMMAVVAVVTMLVMTLIFKFLDKCYKSLKKAGQKVNFACWTTVAMWVALAFLLGIVIH